MRNSLQILLAVLLCSLAWGQNQNSSAANPQSSSGQSMPGMDMSGAHGASNMKDMPMAGDKDDNDATAHVVQSMEGHMDMGPHMKMTDLRKPQPGDAERAQKVVEQARAVADKYVDFHVALADGFKIFLPNVPQKIYHFTNYGYGREASWHFNPDHPTSLLYEKRGSDDYKLVGVMYTAPRRLGEDELDQRIPLSVAQWHEHVNFCRAPQSMPLSEKLEKSLGPNALFGFKGSIHTQQECDAAGGTFYPVVLNWMVHVYPYEKDQAAIWSVERQHAD
jgi:hypothetical protein